MRIRGTRARASRAGLGQGCERAAKKAKCSLASYLQRGERSFSSRRSVGEGVQCVGILARQVFSKFTLVGIDKDQ